jgi:hypothetical protein
MNAGVWHAGEHSVVHCCAWHHGGHVALPYCCAIQCLPHNLATHSAKQSEGRGKHRSLLLHNRVSRFLNVNTSRMGQLCHNILILTSLCAPVSPKWDIPIRYLIKILYTILTVPMHATWPTNFSALVYRQWTRSTNHKTPHNVISFNLLLLPLS